MTGATPDSAATTSLGRRAAGLIAAVIVLGVALLLAVQTVMLRSTATEASAQGKLATAALLAEQVAGGVKWGRAEVVQSAVDKLAALESAAVAHVEVHSADGSMLAEFHRPGADAVDLMTLSQGAELIEIEGYSIVTAPVGDMAMVHIAWPTDVTDAAATKATLIAVAAGLIVAVAVVTGAVAFLRRAVLRPMEALTACMARLADGDNDVVAPGADRTDELGAMARAVDTFRVAALERVELARDAETARASADAERSAAEHAREATAAAQAQVVAALGEGLSQLARGDVTHRIQTPFPAEYEALRSNFNSALGALQESLSDIARNAEDVRDSAGSISSAADDLSQRTESQAASLEESAAAIEEIAATTRRTADGASEAAGIVSNTKGQAESGGEVVRDAVNAMSEIEASSEKIGEIIGVIDEIAFQTNLLALNAGVEAARAGEAGKGFAVVAQEVRALAQRSADAAKQIKDLIMSSKEQVERGVKLVDGAGDALEKIIAGVAEINAAVARIAESAQEQASGLQEVSSAVGQMDQITQQNAGMVEQVSTATSSLSLQTDQFAELIARFRTGYESLPKKPVVAPKPASAPKPAPAKAAAHSAPKSIAAKASTAPAKAAHVPARAAPAPVRVSAPATQRASAAVSEAGWEEF